MLAAVLAAGAFGALAVFILHPRPIQSSSMPQSPALAMARVRASKPASVPQPTASVPHTKEPIGPPTVSELGPTEPVAEQRTDELQAVLALSQEIVSQLELDRLLQAVVQRARELTRARAAALCLLDAGGAVLSMAATTAEPLPGNDPQPLESLVPAGRVLRASETVVIDAACTHCGFPQAHAPGLCAAAPLRTGQATLGALCVVRSDDRPFDHDATRSLTLLANFAAIAISNARLAEAGKTQARETAAAAERERLAVELHDELAQTLSFLRLKVERALDQLGLGRSEEARHELSAMAPALASAYTRVRAALTGLHQPDLDGANLVEQLAACLDEFQEGSDTPAELVVVDGGAFAMTPLARTQAVAIVREALANARRHAAARHVRVVIDRRDSQALVSIEDDGGGFDVGSATGDHHLGLAIMRARAERLGGRLAVDSSPGQGTRVSAFLPLAEAEAGRA